MSTPLMPLHDSRPPVNLAKLTTIFALIFSLGFGMCSVSGISLSSGGNREAARLLIVTALVIESICTIGLVTIGVVACLRSSHRKR